MGKCISLLVYMCFCGLNSLNYIGCPNADSENGKNNDIRESVVAVVAVVSVTKSEKTDDTHNPERSFKENKKLFHPSNEWKNVAPDEMVPPGLHVRINLQTGTKEARLLRNERLAEDGLEGIRKEGVSVQPAMDNPLTELTNQDIGSSNPDFWRQHDGQVNTDANRDKFTKMEMKKALKKLNMEMPQNVSGNIWKIKKEFEEMEINVKLESEILKEHMMHFNNSNITNVEKLEILDSLEYYLHQIDNANLFVDLGGLSLLVQEINKSNEDLQSSSLLALASAVQSNPHSQVSAMKEGLLELCLRVTLTTTSQRVQACGIHCLSTILRNFPFAQKMFSDLGGFESLIDLLRIESIEKKLITKVVTIVTDLKDEQMSTEVDEYLPVDVKQERLKQYERVGLVNKILKTDWCLLVPRFLAFDDPVLKERILNAIWSWIDHCHYQFMNYISELKDIEKQLNVFDVNEDRREYHNELIELIKKITLRLGAKTEL